MLIKNISLILGAVFILVGILGFVPNPLVGSGSLFETDLGHNLVHLLAGAALVVAGLQTEQLSRLAVQAFGAVYLVVGVIGFAVVDSATGQGSLLGLVHLNNADNWLHIALGIVLLALGFCLKPATMKTA
ncbi:MAG: DUF4383 domain-containing protein [Pseudomonadota bacterium]